MQLIDDRCLPAMFLRCICTARPERVERSVRSPAFRAGPAARRPLRAISLRLRRRAIAIRRHRSGRATRNTRDRALYVPAVFLPYHRALDGSIAASENGGRAPEPGPGR